MDEPPREPLRRKAEMLGGGTVFLAEPHVGFARLAAGADRSEEER